MVSGDERLFEWAAAAILLLWALVACAYALGFGLPTTFQRLYGG